MKHSLLFVCYENICRSPMAEGIFSRLIAEGMSHDLFTVASAGTVCSQKGEPPDSRAVSTALAHGIDISAQRARCIHDMEIDRFTKIFVMDVDNYHDIIRYGNTMSESLPVSMVADYLTDSSVGTIDDPYYGTTDDFLTVYYLLSEALGNIYKELSP
ncbi:MAG: low molecular weight phosphotyrosine protein phosphatase [Chlorobium sp.]|nr:low molecular weight phosphotyrosine protein phosphatase [Chlorobium sp.]MCW8815013.1 low molecular weight phosphotyrosine protein phosphatase [Chlorobium sp.]MCW8819599.1 low molecular weight phosphotyrosine protein phosphatase [Ignavibacteriaceae bacterium]